MFKRKDKKKIIPKILIGLFAVLSALSLFMNGDDYLWYYSGDQTELNGWSTPNGRLFSNQITIWLVRNIPFRTIFVALTLILFLFFLAKLIDFKNVTANTKYYMALIFLIMIPCRTYKETVLWISGFTNYIFSMVIILFFLLFFFNCLFNDYVPHKISAIFFLGLGIIGGLCVEHITIYNSILSAACVVIALKSKKKCLLHTVSFMAGAVTACVLMFNNNIYSDIYSDSDSVGGRYFKFDFSDIFHTAFSYVAVHYTKDFWIAPILLSVSFTFIYYKKEHSEKTPKYLKPSLTICWLYSGYSVFTSCFSNIRYINAAMRIVALETAFSFMYVVSLAYLIYLYLDKNGKIRSYLYLISSFLVTSQFLFVSPVTPRCFFANYFFWILLCGELLFTVIWMIGSERFLKVSEKAVGILSAALASIITFICLSNRYFDDLRYDYIRKQISSGRKNLNIIMLPYSEYTSDDLENGLLNNQEHVGHYFYSDYKLMYHDIEVPPDKEYVEIQVSPYDYYMEKES